MDITIWTILEIAPTTDIKAIKSAYAAKLKTLDVDQQMAAFQELKATFDAALDYARSGADETVTPTELLGVDRDGDPFAVVSQTNEAEYSFTEWDGLQIFSVELRQLKQAQAYFDDLPLWEELTKQVFDWGIEEYWENQYLIQLFLLNNFRWLSKQVIDYLIAVFDLEDLNEQIMESKYISRDFRQHLSTIKNVPPFSFAIWSDIPQDSREQYFAARYEACHLLTRNHIYAGDPFSQRIADCLSLTQKDVEIYALQLAKLLFDKNGEALTDDEKQQFNEWLTEAARLDGTNQTIRFLRDYQALVMEKNERPPSQKSEWAIEELLIPKPASQLLYEEMLFQQKSYTRAFIVWKQLSRDQRLSRIKKYNTIKQQLPEKEQNELRQLNKHLHKQTKQYQQKKANQASFTRGFFVVAVAILMVCTFLGGIGKRSEKLSKADIELINKVQKENYNSTLKRLKESPLGVLRKTMIARTMTESLYLKEESSIPIDDLFASEELKTAFNVHRVMSQESDYDREDFSYHSRLDGQEMLRYISVYHKEDLLYVLTVDATNETITAIYGEEWTPLSEEEMLGMVNFTKVKKQEITFLFVKEFLFSEDRGNALENYGVYFSPSLRITMEKNLALPIPENFRNGWLTQVDLNYNDIDYALMNEQEEVLYLAFDEEDRLHCVYGEDWETKELPIIDVIGEEIPVIDVLNSY